MAININKIISAILTPLYLIIDFFVKLKKPKTKNNSKFLLIFLGEIGDYILFRNFIEEIKKDPQYKNYSITFLGNILWKDLSEKFDSNNISVYFWVDKKMFLTNIIYRYKILKKLRGNNFQIVLRPGYGRFFALESLVNVARSKLKIGNFGGLKGMYFWQRNISDKYYTHLIPSKKGINFEFIKNQEFFSNFLNKKIKQNLQISVNKNKNKNYVVVVPGAGASFRRWPTINFSGVCDFITENYGLPIKILGSKKDSSLAKQIISNSKYPEKLEDLTGNKLSDSVGIIGNSKFILANDSGAVHIAAATKTPVFCISNGNQYGKFHPYPKEISQNTFYIYPKKFNHFSKKELIKKYGFVSDINMNEISLDEVIQTIKKKIPSL